jgi:protein O-mannosyl-transferase
LITILFSVKTISRNRVWKNDLTLFTTDIITSENSAKGNCAAGGILLDTYQNNQDVALRNEKVHQAIQYLQKAIVIHPKYTDAWLMLGNAWALYPDSILKAERCYEQIMSFSPGNEKAIHNLEYLTTLVKDPLQKAQLLENILKYTPQSYDVLYKLGNIWGKELNNLPKATHYLELAIVSNPSGKEALKDLGVAYALQNEFRKSCSIMERAVKLDSTDASVWINMGLTYSNLKEMDKANRCFEKAKRLQSAQNEK